MAVLALVGLPGAKPAEDPVARELRLKAAFVYRLVDFVRWPETCGDRTPAPLALGILGSDERTGGNPFGDAFDEVVGTTVQGRRLSVEHLGPVPAARERPEILERARACDVVFLAADGQADVAALVEELRGACTLTLSDQPGFAESGGMVGLVRWRDKIRLEANLRSLRAAGIQIPASLLELPGNRVVGDDAVGSGAAEARAGGGGP